MKAKKRSSKKWRFISFLDLTEEARKLTKNHAGEDYGGL